MTEKNKLLGRIREYGFTQKQLAESIGITSVTLAKKLKGYRDFKGKEIEEISVILEIPNADLHKYFFE